MEQADACAGRGASLGRARHPPDAGVRHRHWQQARAARQALPAHARARGRLPGDHGLRGRGGRGGAAPARRGAPPARGRRPRARPRPGEAWLRSRFSAPYLRDDLLGRRVLVETLETATSWSNLEALYDAVGAALRTALQARGTPPLVLCHISHLYRSGASLYFTFLARQEDDALGQWEAAKSAAGEAIVGAGATITHHHAIGRDHAPLDASRGRRARPRLDPRGQGAARPGRDHEPGQAAAGLSRA